MDCIREAANSIANGIPSRRRQISTTACVARCQRRTGRHGKGALDEQRCGGELDVQRRHRPELLVGHPEALPAGGQHLHRRRASEDAVDQVGGGVQHVLAVVEHQQARAALQRGSHAVRHGHTRLLGDPEDGRHRLGHRGRIADRGQLDHPDPVGEVVRRSRGDLKREPRLADPADSGQRHQPVLPSAVSTSASSVSRPTKLVVGGRRFPAPDRRSSAVGIRSAARART